MEICKAQEAVLRVEQGPVLGWKPDRNRIKTTGGEFQYRVDLLTRHVELLNDLIDGAPASRFSNTADTGVRVSRNTHAPPNVPGTLSAAGHCDQSRSGHFDSPFL
jgi:hypothetical protein